MDDAPAGFSIVIPAYDAAASLDECLAAMDALSGDPATREVIVVDDGSIDATGAIAAAHGCTVLRNPAPVGPATARNRGAAAARFDTLVFVDADVVVPADTLERFSHHLLACPESAAVVASRSPWCPHRNLASRYKNYWTAYNWMAQRRTHCLNSSCLAIRRRVFVEFGGFDESLRDAFFEDDELGHRLTERGRPIEVAEDLQVVHRKFFTVRSLLSRDTKPLYASYLVRSGKLGASLRRLRYSSVNPGFLLSYPLLAAALLALALAVADARFLALSAGLLGAVLAINAGFWAFVLRQEGRVVGLLQVMGLFLFHVFNVGNAQLAGWARAWLHG